MTQKGKIRSTIPVLLKNGWNNIKPQNTENTENTENTDNELVNNLMESMPFDEALRIMEVTNEEYEVAKELLEQDKTLNRQCLNT